MNYIVTGSGLDKLPSNITKDSVIFLLYQEDDSVLFKDIAALYESGIQLVFIPISTKEEALICVGSILARTDECEVLSEELSASTAYLRKISKIFGGNYGHVRMASEVERVDVSPASVISDPNDETNVSADERSEQTISAIQRARRASEKEIASRRMREEDTAKSDDILSTKNAKALYNMIRVRAADVGFSLGTEPLMQAILNVVATSGSDVEVKTRIEEMTGGKTIWKQMQPKLSDIRKLVGK